MTGSWVAIDVPLSDFVGLTAQAHIAQLIISGDPNTVYVDNVYFYAGELIPTEPTVAAPTPTADPADVISLFSNAYNDVPVDTWSAVWDVADVADVQIVGDDVKLYTGLVYAGIEFTTQTIDASSMTHFYMDIWTPDPTADPAVFKVKLVDFGADGAWSGGDDVEHELSFMAPTLETASWVTLAMPLADFTALTTREHLAQLIISGDPNTVYVDNIYFWGPASGIDTAELPLPGEHALSPNYPNPFNPSTSIRYSIAERAEVRVSVYDLRGQLVKTLVSGAQAPGNYSAQWDGRDNSDHLVATGVYLGRLEAGTFNQTIKMVYIK
jgi:hypothetical protein